VAYADPVRTLLAVAAFLALAGAAAAGNIATPTMTAVASWTAGKPVAVHCESEPAAWDRLVAQSGYAGLPGTAVAGFAVEARSAVYLRYDRCAMLAGPEHEQFAIGLHTLLQEAYRLRGAGTTDAGLLECAALVLQYEAMRRFYGVPFFSAAMRRHAALAIARSRSLPAGFGPRCP
jgi:hypothetical protein